MKIKIWKIYNPDRLWGGYEWNLEEIRNDWDGIYSDPYETKLPEEFYVGETMGGADAVFKQGCSYAYVLTISDSQSENGVPLLVGGSPVEMIKLSVTEILETR